MSDPNGNVTKWAQDHEGRQISKTYADGTQVLYTYENTTSRLKTMIDAIGQVTSYTYHEDDKLQQVSYANATHATPTVSLTYDPVYPRAATMVDGTGTTTYGYGSYSTYSSYAAFPGTPTTGAGQLTSETKAGVSGLASYTLAYGYDALERQVSRSVDGSANSATLSYDNLGRVTGVTNLLGTFGYNYTTPTSRQVSLAYLGNPTSGLRTSYSYFPNNGDKRLQTLNNQTPSGATISSFTYAYNAVGDITTWTQQTDNTTPQAYGLGYDSDDELTSAVLTNTSTQAVLHTYVYGYDWAANRTSSQLDLSVTGATANKLNQLTSLSASGPLRFSGTLSKPSTVTVGGNAATVNSNNTFTGFANINPGTNTVAVTATDGSGNTSTNNYQVQAASGTGQTLTYDLNGNLINDGAGKTFEWDAVNRLTAINYTVTNSRTEFAYDGLSRRTRIVEKSNGSVTSTKLFVWYWGDQEPCEERNSNNAVTKCFFSRGEQINGTNYYFTQDHLGTIREMTDASGSLHARYSYDPYGVPSANLITTNPVQADFGFTGLYFHQPSGLHLAHYRDYNAVTGRWLTKDPLGPMFDVNLYRYCYDDTTGLLDPDGRGVIGIIVGGIIGAASGAAGAASRGGGWGNIAIEGGIGALVGAGIGAIDPSEGILGASLIGAAVSGLGDAAAQIAETANEPCPTINVGETIGAMAGGALGGAFGGVGGALGGDVGATIGTVVGVPAVTSGTNIGWWLGGGD